MSDKLLILERTVQEDLRTIDRLYSELGEDPLPEGLSQDAVIVVAYRLHGLYNAMENIFRNIADTFENSLKDPSRWHAELLQRMKLDLSPVRPAVIDAEAFEKLDELRRFRHLFRAAYGVVLDPRRLSLVADKALEVKPLFRAQVERFLERVQEA
jgi:hypothetical protein